jgi:hypothetical protein
MTPIRTSGRPATIINSASLAAARMGQVRIYQRRRVGPVQRIIKCAMCQKSRSIIKILQPQPRLSSPKQHKSWSSTTTST